MIFVFSFLLIVLGPVMFIPAIRQLLNMQDINKNRATSQGKVLSLNSLFGPQGGRMDAHNGQPRSASAWGYWTMGFGNQDRPLIQYHSHSGAELVLEVIASSMLYKNRYEIRQTVEITYDSTRPGRAYVTQEWKFALRELWLGSGALIIGIILWVIGRVYNLPS